MLKAALMVAAAVCLIAGAAQAQSPQAQSSWPNKPVKILVPTAAGGSADNTARMFAAHLSKVLGQQFYIENRGGAGNTLGIESVARSPPTATRYCSAPARSPSTISSTRSCHMTCCAT